MKYIGHGGKEIIERILLPAETKQTTQDQDLKKVPVTDRVARECIDLAYGFFSPLHAFMNAKTLVSVCHEMKLLDGTFWPIPIVFDITEEEIKEKEIKEKDTILLTYYGNALAILEVEEIFKHDKIDLEEAVLGTSDLKHPGVKMYNTLKDAFISGIILYFKKSKVQDE